jgi:NAD(P)-dependent dehydrogenase (short-subunit alcohol dehydrogenase family)
VNVEGPLLTTREAAALMVRQDPHPITGCRGRIINVSSPAAEVGRPMFAAYGASKAALNHLSKTSALVLGPQLIATTVLYPGSVLGPLWDALLPDLVAAEGRTADEILAERTAGMPQGRFQLPEETAAMALYIATAPGMSLNGRVLWSEAHVAPL